MLRIALAGNPNSGKTTVFNGLTGSNQSVGNWPGVTVEKKTGFLKHDSFEAQITDLPGIYSLSTVSLEEEIAAKFIMNNTMDLIVNVVDASNLERNLFLTYQLLDRNVPIVVALNCMDLVEKKLDEINVLELQRALKIPVVPITASKKHGISDLVTFLASYIPEPMGHPVIYSDKIESTIHAFQKEIPDRFFAIRLFEDGIKGISYLNYDEDALKRCINLYETESKKYELDFDMVLPSSRYDDIIKVCNKVLKKSDVTRVSITDKIDRILTHKWLGLPLFALIMMSVFYLAFGPVGSFITGQFVSIIQLLFGLIQTLIDKLGMAAWVSSLVTNGIFGGLASVVGFLPQLMILFFFLAVLEDSGYMSRAAFIMDRALRKFGLSGKSFIPMLIGFGCSVPAISSTRTLDKVEDRRLTTMIIPFISCGAKAPIYGVFAGALFASNSYLVVFSMYVLGILIAIFSAILFKKTILKGASANYIMEMPEYRMPSVKNMWLHTWERSKGFLIKAGTILLGAFIIIWFLSYFGIVDRTFRLLGESEIGYSFLASIGKWLLPLFRPIGFTEWQSTVAMLSGFVAKESVVGTLGILYGISGNVIENGNLLYVSIQSHFTALQAYAFLTFALLATPCIAALSAMKRELSSWKWFLFIIVYEIVVAYAVSLMIYQIGMLGLGGALSIILGVGIIGFLLVVIKNAVKKKGLSCSHCAGCNEYTNCHLPKREIIFLNKEENDGKNE